MYTLKPSSRKHKKFMINDTLHFGDNRYQDFTTHKDERRKESYLSRHARRENWTKQGINTAGFWSRWLLWNKPTLHRSIEDTERRFNIRIKR